MGVPDRMAVLETAGRGSIPRRGTETKHVLGVLRIARDPAKVEDQVRLLARTLNDVALEPDGKATACKAVMKWVRPPPALLIRPGQRRSAPCPFGSRELDQFLADKDAVAKELETSVRQRVAALGLEVISVGIRDVILPGDMKDLMNKVTEAKKAAEANLIVRREETAAMRSQANTAKVLEGNPTLIRLRELEVLDQVAASGKLNIVLGEKGLAERIVNLL